MTDLKRPLHYRSYLLRFWEERPLPDPALGRPLPIGRWRFSLEDPHGGARLGFADFDQLIAYLSNQMQSNSKGEYLMSTEETRQIVQQHIDDLNRAFSTGNFDLLDATVAVDFVEHAAFAGAAPGLAGWKQSMATWQAAIPDFRFEVLTLLADGDKAMFHSMTRGTHLGDMMGIPPTGKELALEAIDIVRVQDGKVVEHWGVFDEMAMMRQLGLIPEPGSEG